MGNVSPGGDLRDEPAHLVIRRLSVRTATVTMSPAPRPEADASDGVLVRRVAAGDDSALEALYDRYGRPAFALARRITGEPVFAEEVVQEVFLALWRKADGFRADRGSVGTWLMSAVHHKAVDTVRREQAERRRNQGASRDAEIEEDVAEVVTEEAAVHEARATVRSVLRQIPLEQRQVLELMYFEGKTQARIASELAVPLGTVKSRTFLGMRRLRDLLANTPGM